MRKLLFKTILLLNNTTNSEKGKGPLSLSKKVNLLGMLLAILIAIIIGNTFIFALQKLSLQKMRAVTIAITSDTENRNKQLNSRNVSKQLAILLPEYKTRIPSLSERQLTEIKTLLNKPTITFSDLVTYIRSQVGTKHTRTDIIKDIHGSHSGLPILTFNRTQIPMLMMERYGLSKPRAGKNRLSEEELHFYLMASLISEFRGIHMTMGHFINIPYWLLTAFGGLLQWLIFFISIWCALLLIFKLLWVELQQHLILKGHLLNKKKELEANIWNIEKTNPNELPLFYQLSLKYPSVLLPIIMIEKVLKNRKVPQKIAFEAYIMEEVTMFQSKSVTSFSFINALYQSCPNIGFCGTIIGATLAFGHASGVLKETDPFFQGEEIGILTGDLSLSFFTTLTGLLAVLVLSFLMSKVTIKEARLFELLEQQCKKQMNHLWVTST